VIKVPIIQNGKEVGSVTIYDEEETHIKYLEPEFQEREDWLGDYFLSHFILV
jgi:hypothetical protein